MSPRLFLRVAGVEARKRMAYRADFWIQSVAVFLVELGTAWFVWAYLFAASGRGTIAGWSRDGAFLYYVVVVLSARVVRGNDFGDAAMSQDVYDGRLTPYLLYPAPYLGLKYAQHVGALAPSLVQFVLFGAAFPFLVRAPDASVGPAGLAMGAVSLAAANLLYYAMSYPVQAVAFWAENVWSLAVAQRLVCNLLGGLMLPLSVYPEWAQDVLRWLPFRHLYSEPASAILGRADVGTWLSSLLAALLWAAGFLAAGLLVFRRGRLRYTGVGI